MLARVRRQSADPARIFRLPARRSLETQRRIADRARDIEEIAFGDPAPRHHLAMRNSPDRGDRENESVGTFHRVAADQRTGIGFCILAETRGETRKPGLRPIRRQREAQEKSQRLRGFSGKIGEIDAQRLLGDRIRRIVGKEIDAGRQHIGRDDEFVAGRRIKQSRIVGKAQSRRPRERREIGGDQFVFRRARHEFALRFRLSRRIPQP